jgi:hypothetical protein
MLEYRITELTDTIPRQYRVTANGRSVSLFTSLDAAANTARLLGSCDHQHGEDVVVTVHSADGTVKVLETMMGDAIAYRQMYRVP